MNREGAIFHWFALLGKYQYDELENELMTILKEKGLREGDPFDETVIQSKIKILNAPTQFNEIFDKTFEYFEAELQLHKNTFKTKFLQSLPDDSVIALPGVLIFHAKHTKVLQPSMQIIISKTAISSYNFV